MSRRSNDLTPDLVLRAYRAGLFPMAEDRESDMLHWLDPPRRGILPLDAFHVPRRLMKSVKSGLYSVTFDSDFAATVQACAAPRPGQPQTWINPQIERVFTDLHRAGYAHSVECRQDGVLVGGLYGVAMGAVFFGESMFSTARDASKIALVHLVDRMRRGGYRLLDTQFVTEHLAQFGAIEIPRYRYKMLLAEALAMPGRFGGEGQGQGALPPGPPLGVATPQTP